MFYPLITMSIKRKLIVIASIIVLFIGGILIYKATSNKTEYRLITVKKGEVVQNVSVTGTVTPAKQIDLQFENTGRIEAIEIEVGQEVEAGQTLARLNTGELAAQLRAAQASLDIAKAKLEQTLSGNRPEDIKVYEVAVTNAETDLKNKKQELEDTEEDASVDLDSVYEDVPNILHDAYLNADDALQKQLDDLFTDDNTNSPSLSYTTGDSQAKIDSEWQRVLAGEETSQFQDEISSLDFNNYDSLNLALTRGKQHLEVVRDFLNRVMDTLNNAIINDNLSATELATYKSSVNTARTNINTEIINITSQEQTIATTKITNQTNINKAKTAVDKAEATLEDAKAQLALKKADPLQADVDLARAEVRKAQADISQINEKIAKSYLTAPVKGIVTLIEKEEGETAQSNTTVISLMNSSPFQVEANISETEIAKVVLGDKAGMTLDALPNEKFSGKVIRIDPAETIVSGVIYYQVTAAFEGRDERIKSGMTVNLDIQTDTKQDVLYLPYYVVKSRDSENYVRVLEDKEIKEKTVKIGLEGDVNVEITEGLREGEQVIFGE